MQYRKDIDGLRALAILFTIGFHGFPKQLSNGYLGVDIFFVISGFLITSVILSNLLYDNFSLINFYCKRIKRILPISLLVLSTVALTGSLTLFQNEYWSLRKYIPSTAGFYVNFTLLNDSIYFGLERTYKPLIHYWSLAIEEQFYLVWPVVLMILFFIAKRVEFFKTRFFGYLITAVSLMLLPSLLYFLISTEDLYFSTFARIWELMVGCTAAILYSHKNNSANLTLKINKYAYILNAFAFALIIYAMFLDRKLATVLSVMAAFILILTPEFSFFKKILTNKFSVKIGLMSFSLYLWHWPVLSFYNIYKLQVTPQETAILIVLIFAISYISFEYVEKIIKNQNWDLIKNNKFAPISLVPILFCFGSSLFFITTKIPKIPDKVTAELIYKEDSELDILSNCTLTQKYKVMRIETWCFEQIINSEVSGVLIGDSQAHVLYRGFVTESKKIKWHLISAESCPPFLLPDVYSACANMVSDFYKNIGDRKDFKYVVFVMGNGTYNDNMNQFKDPAIKVNLINNLKKLSDNGKQIYFVRPIPTFPTNIAICSRQRFSFYKVFDLSHLCYLDNDLWKQSSFEFNQFIDQLKAEVPQLVILDFTDRICDGNKCHVIREGKSLYQDMGHLSFEGNRQSAEIFLRIIESSK